METFPTQAWRLGLNFRRNSLVIYMLRPDFFQNCLPERFELYCKKTGSIEIRSCRKFPFLQSKERVWKDIVKAYKYSYERFPAHWRLLQFQSEISISKINRFSLSAKLIEYWCSLAMDICCCYRDDRTGAKKVSFYCNRLIDRDKKDRHKILGLMTRNGLVPPWSTLRKSSILLFNAKNQ